MVDDENLVKFVHGELDYTDNIAKKKVKDLITEAKNILDKEKFERLKPLLNSDEEFLKAAEHLLVDGESIKNLFKELVKT